MKKKFLLACVLGAFTLPAMADNFYIFGDVGQGKMAVDAGNNSTIDKTSTTYSIGAGYDVNQFLAVEVAYRDLGDIEDRGIEFDGVDDYEYVDKYQTTILQASVVGKLPISEEFNVYGRVGLASIDADDESRRLYEDGNNPKPETSAASKTRALFGVGASFDISSQLAVRAEYNQYAKWNDLKLSALTVGAVYKF
jgi:opacity protein-like surface antigen